MEKKEIQDLYDDFLRKYNQDDHRIWEEKRREFMDFWNSKIENSNVKELKEAEIDQVVRILDNRALGNRKTSTAIARIMVPQGAWRRMFHEFKANERIRSILTDIFSTDDDLAEIQLVDTLYKVNEERKNNLTGPSANVINALLFVSNPSRHVSVVSLNDRKKVIEYFRFLNSPDFENDTIGKKVVLSNKAIIEGFRAYGITSHPRTISRFLYTTLLEFWKPEVKKIRIGHEEVEVSIPDKDESERSSDIQTPEMRESIKIQAKLAFIGETLGFKIWLPKGDRSRVTQFWKPAAGSLLEALPMAPSSSVLRVIENIDVLWINHSYIARAFEVEDKTSIISGILRMGDLLAVQPNMEISIYLVAPSESRERVRGHINRPVFAGISRRKLSEVCKYLSYDSVNELAAEKKLKSMKESVVDDSYAESMPEP